MSTATFPLQSTAAAASRGPYLNEPVAPGVFALNQLSRFAREARNLARAVRSEHGDGDISQELDDIAAMAQAAVYDVERMREGG